MILRGMGDAVEGEKLVAVARKISKPIIIHATAKHRAQQCTYMELQPDAT